MTDPRTADTSIADSRTELRDARLRKALAHAPDGDGLPAPSTRNTIKNIANNAIRTLDKAEFDTQSPWWKVLWDKTGRAGLGGRAAGPWNAAFATLLLGGIITLIWQGQPVRDAVLDAVPDKQPAAQRAPGKTPAAADATPQVGPPVPKDAPARAPANAAVSEAAVLPVIPVPAPAPEPTPAPAPAMRREAPALEQRESTAGVTPGADKSMRDMAAASQQERAQATAAIPASPAPGVPGAVGSTAERIARNDSSNRNGVTLFAPAELQPDEWTAADVLYQGRTTRLARREAQNLVTRAVSLIAGIADANAKASPSASALPGGEGERGAPLLRLQLLRQEDRVLVAQFELRDAGFRWQRVGQVDVVGALTLEAVASLLAQATRVLPP